MTEKDFWEFLCNLLKQGRIDQLSGVIDSDEPQLSQARVFIGGHALLPKKHDKIARDKIIEMSELLLCGDAAIPTREAIIIILAHHPSREALNYLRKYNQNPDEELRFFSQFALDECLMWNDL